MSKFNEYLEAAKKGGYVYITPEEKDRLVEKLKKLDFKEFKDNNPKWLVSLQKDAVKVQIGKEYITVRDQQKAHESHAYVQIKDHEIHLYLDPDDFNTYDDIIKEAEKHYGSSVSDRAAAMAELYKPKPGAKTPHWTGD